MGKNCYIVELAVDGNGLDSALSRRIVDFHKTLRTNPQHGRTKTLAEGVALYGWCFSDLKTARDFMERFGGTLRQREIKQYVRLKKKQQHLGQNVSRSKAVSGAHKNLIRRLRILHAVLFETAKLRTEGSADAHDLAVEKVARVENIEIETVERYCRLGVRFMKSIRAADIRPENDIRPYVEDVRRLLLHT